MRIATVLPVERSRLSWRKNKDRWEGLKICNKSATSFSKSSSHISRLNVTHLVRPGWVRCDENISPQHRRLYHRCQTDRSLVGENHSTAKRIFFTKTNSDGRLVLLQPLKPLRLPKLLADVTCSGIVKSFLPGSVGRLKNLAVSSEPTQCFNKHPNKKNIIQAISRVTGSSHRPGDVSEAARCVRLHGSIVYNTLLSKRGVSVTAAPE